jgi:CHAT domain-containing protein
LRLSTKTTVSSKFAQRVEISAIPEGDGNSFGIDKMPVLSPGNELTFKVQNKSQYASDVTMLFIDSAYGITILYPEPGASNRIGAGNDDWFKGEPDVETVGIERMIIIAVQAKANTMRTDFSFLAQASLPKTRDNNKFSMFLRNIGVVYDNLAQYQTALDYYQQALKIQREIKDRYGEGINLTNFGLAYKNLGKYQQAKEAFQGGATILETVSLNDLWEAQCGLASTEAKLNQAKSAIQHYEQSIDNIEKLRAGITAKKHKISFMRNKMGAYDEFIALLQYLHQTQPQKGYDRKAIEIFERKQARIFLEEMGQSGARLFAGLPQEILQGESDLENQLAKTRKNLVDERFKPVAGIKGEEVQNKQRIKNLEQHEQKNQTKLEELQQTIKTKYPDYYALKYPKPVKLDSLQKEVLESDELMLVYGVMENSTALWVIGKNTFEMFDLPLSESMLKEKISQLRDWMGTGDKTRGLKVTKRKYGEVKVKLNQASNELYAQLIPEKVRSLLTTPHTVYVIPTGPLYALPFETLVTKASKDFKKAHYLIEDVPIAYLSSASLLKILRDAQKRRQDTAHYPLLAFANPIYEGTPTSSSTPRGIIDKLHDETYRNLKNGFAPLPETEDEAKEIAKLLNAPTDSKALQLGEDASVPTVNKFNKQTRLDDYQYLLFSTHGILPGEVDRIKQPALVLSYPEKLGYLKMADVFGLKLNAKLVALSACNTGNGKNEKGEGVMGLTRAFMYAGTPAIAVTLWSVESLSAKTLNVGFFKELKNIQKPAAALRAIKLRMLRGDEGEKYKRPYYWASFVVFGDAG